jgi:hypothetical protein
VCDSRFAMNTICCLLLAACCLLFAARCLLTGVSCLLVLILDLRRLLHSQVIKTGGVSEMKKAIAEVVDIDEDMLAIGEIEKDWQGRSITDMALLKKGAKVSWLPSRRGSELYAYELESRPR